MTKMPDFAAGPTLVELADLLAGHYELTDFLHWLVEHCVVILDVAAGAVLLEAHRRRLALATATTPEMEAFERWQIEYREGPCWDAYEGVAPVVVEDLRADDRWPNVRPRAVGIGILAVYAFPLRLRDDCLGVLNLYRQRPGSLSHDQARYAQAFADIAAVGILTQGKVTEAERRAEQLQHALHSRVVIEQAKGILAERYGVSLADAFEALRTYARSNRMKISKASQAVVDGLM